MDRITDHELPIQRSEKARTTIQTLAPELLSEIFAHCIVGLGQFHESTRIRCLSQAPLLLGRVCRRWRTVSISSPELWSSFAIGGKGVWDVDLEKDLEASNYWNSKSGARPLSIFICYPQFDLLEALLPPVLESLVSQSWRWKVVEMYIPFEFESIVCAPFQAGILPQLVKFESHIIGRRGSAELVLSSAPRLQSLCYLGSGVHVDFSGGAYDIKKIDIYDSSPRNRISVVDLFTCFTQCPLLENLTIRIYIGEFGAGLRLPDELPSTIELSHLTHLILAFHEDIDPCCLFDRLFLPVLISLDLHMDTGDNYTDWPHLRTMLTRSRPPLQNLRLSFVPMTEETLVRCLSNIPTLTTLDTYGMFFGDNILNALTMAEADPNASENLCPWLEIIKFTPVGDLSERAMTRMILSRRNNAKSTGFASGTALKQVISRFAFSGIRSNPDIAECIKDGLRLYGTD